MSNTYTISSEQLTEVVKAAAKIVNGIGQFNDDVSTVIEHTAFETFENKIQYDETDPNDYQAMACGEILGEGIKKAICEALEVYDNSKVTLKVSKDE